MKGEHGFGHPAHDIYQAVSTANFEGFVYEAGVYLRGRR